MQTLVKNQERLSVKAIKFQIRSDSRKEIVNFFVVYYEECKFIVEKSGSSGMQIEKIKHL